MQNMLLITYKSLVIVIIILLIITITFSMRQEEDEEVDGNQFSPKSKDSSSPSSRLIQNLNCNQELNDQIKLELEVSMIYLSMSNHFCKDYIALNGLSHLFLHQHGRELSHAYKIIKYIRSRGGVVKIPDINVIL
jgi:hypothetical protein